MHYGLQGNASAYFHCDDREVLNESGARTGKGQPLWATVWTPHGPREMGALRVGDEILGGDGRTTRVSAIHELGVRTIYRVVFSTGENVFVTDDHLWACLHPRNHAGGDEVLSSLHTTLDLRRRLRRNPRLDYWTPQTVAHFAPQIEPLPLAPYALGVLLGDGGLTQGQARFTTYPRDIAIVERMRTLWPRVSTFSSGVDHALTGAAPILRQLGLAGKNSTAKHIPEVYRRASPEDRAELLRGLMDTDGSVDRSSGGMPRFSSSSCQLAKDFLEVLQGLGGAGIIEGKPTAGADHFNVWFRYDDGPSLFHLQRKREACRRREKFVLRRFFREIEPLSAPEPARCISVENPDGLYLTDNFIVTHNTHCELVKAYFTATAYPGSRQLFARETRKSLTETVLPDWETKILGLGHPAIGKARRNNRDAYHFQNGSTVVLHGLDDPENLLSGEFDRIYLFQAEQLPRQDTWDALLTRLSGNMTPYCQATADANPSHERHWLIRRVKETLCLACATVVDPDLFSCQSCGSTQLGKMRHFQFRHTDNPRWFDWHERRWTAEGEEYLIQKLGRTRGVRRKRLLLHLWVSEEGQVLEDYDPAIHRISGRLEQQASGGWILNVTSPGWTIGSKDPMREARIPIDWFGAGADWGFSPHPGVLQVWGYDRHGRRFLVAEVYKTLKQLSWWGEVASALWKEFRFRYIAADPSAPALIDAFNRRIAQDHNVPALAIGADNVIRRQSPDLAGIDLMRWGLKDDRGMVRTFLLKDALRYGIDEELRDASKPVCTEDEIPEWVFERKKSTDEPTDRPDPNCANHGLDAWRYEAGEGWIVREAATVGKPQYPEGSAGAIHKHAEKMAKARAWREEHGG